MTGHQGREQTLSENSLPERVAALERQVAQLTAQLAALKTKDWRSTVGMFPGNEAMKRVDAAGQAIREKERERVRKRQAKKRPAKS
jgi:hypothetical protein